MMRIFRIITFLWVFVILIHNVASATLEDGLIGYWPLDGDAQDKSGNGYHGIVRSGARFTPDVVAGRQVLQSAYGPINTGHIYVNLPARYHPGDGVVGHKNSGSVWVMFDDRTPGHPSVAVQGIIGHPPGLRYFDRALETNTIRTMVYREELAGANKNYWVDTPIQSVAKEGVWYHFAWTFHTRYDGGEGHLKFYLNGKLVMSQPRGLQSARSWGFIIGGNHEGYGTNAKFAEVRLYDRNLSDEEVQRLARWPGFHPLGHYPQWWFEQGVIGEAIAPDDYAAVNQGQLKHIATKAAAYMDDALGIAGGAGNEVNALTGTWATPASGADDFAAINLGQLKFVAKPFYDRLLAIGYAEAYPWAGASSGADDYAIANVGQLKNLFSFELSSVNVRAIDSDRNGLPDWWELNHFGVIGVNPAADPDGDGLSNLAESLLDLDPNAPATAVGKAVLGLSVYAP